MRKTFVSYAWHSAFQQGYGNLDWDGPIYSRDDIVAIRKFILDTVKDHLNSPVTQVVVLSWKHYD
jgi:hypothetical protein